MDGDADGQLYIDTSASMVHVHMRVQGMGMHTVLAIWLGPLPPNKWERLCCM